MILVSSCLLGERVRYDGNHQLNEKLLEYYAANEVIHACPELMGGLTVPREPAEIQDGDGCNVLDRKAKVVTVSGIDVTQAYIQGAEHMLNLCKENNVTTVILKENSPSCGSQKIYDGTFQSIKMNGQGVTTALLQRHGITVINEDELYIN